jgi:flagellar hook protein FlgE
MANIGPSGIAGKGKIQAGALEMSNVDMADQLTDMIITQRGFQVNSRTIQTADQLLQELLTLKR